VLLFFLQIYKHKKVSYIYNTDNRMQLTYHLAH